MLNCLRATLDTLDNAGPEDNVGMDLGLPLPLCGQI